MKKDKSKMKMSHTHTTILILLLVMLVAVVVPAHAQDSGVFSRQLVPCDGTEADPCDFDALVQLAQNVINFLIAFAVLLAAILFTYAGFLYVTSAGNLGQVERAHKIFKNVLIGFIIALAAWLIVYTITNSLLKGGAPSLLESPN